MAVSADLTELTALIVACFVSNNSVARVRIPQLISDTHAALMATGKHRPPTPAVPIEESITEEHLICLEDGRKLRSLQRYLQRKFSLTPEQYRMRWNLPPDYPMVAPGYSALRSQIAKRTVSARRS